MRMTGADERVLFRKGERRFDLGNVEVIVMAPRDITVGEAQLEGMVRYARNRRKPETGEGEASCGRGLQDSGPNRARQAL